MENHEELLPSWIGRSLLNSLVGIQEEDYHQFVKMLQEITGFMKLIPKPEHNWTVTDFMVVGYMLNQKRLNQREAGPQKRPGP